MCLFGGGCSPFRSGQKSFKKGEEKKADADVNSPSLKPAGKGETGWGPERLSHAAVAVCLKHLSSAPYCNVDPSSFFVSPHSSCPRRSSLCASESDETSPTSDRAAVAKKRFTLQGFSSIKAQKGNCRPQSLTSPPKKCHIASNSPSRNEFIVNS